ncbi:MBL fold metallo-hydrolase [Pararobbsia silviterrae]|uniref:MBL fold metallo-hydrolase n=1 Tax=Pararobbsia silviterrae TaxID=1792498 RepID=A0A494XMG3_9BURK|nr:MBL fold metallo-hydrolase [Pararobbsia silviterrae]RKP51877.1 MBL fold metallo-hydrolase [Pararobbsia silviterrae]
MATVASESSEGVGVRLDVESFDEPLATRLARRSARVEADAGTDADADVGTDASTGAVRLYWLGQAGFVIDSGPLRMLVDPYLSDTLAHKYRGTHYPHTRMMGAPLAPRDLDRLDLVLCTHRHTDHMDPGTLQPLAERFPALRFVVPAATIDEAIARCGVGIDRLVAVNAGECVEVIDGCVVSPIASAHETLDCDAQGRYPWLGYVIETGGVRIYHSGDGIPYPALAEAVAARRPDIALLPVNGRDAARSGNGVPGNFTLDEAVSLARDARVPNMIAHHYGLFDFNTVEPEIIDDRIAAERGALHLYRAQTQVAWRAVRAGASR